MALKKILIANRGEIALRVMRTCREMGIPTVAVFSDADEKAAHVLGADEAVHIGLSDPLESYLHVDRIITAAKETGADAVHPGYGFLAENAGFAARCRDERLTFIGPPAEVIASLGDKTVARRMMKKSGVPVIPGMTESERDYEKMAQEADKLGYPVLIKAAGGGGGKGMRVVNDPGELEEACDAAAREAQAAFGNNAVYLEKYLEQPRHIEFQILADTHGNVIHLLERECSVQRRHQKIIEESPSPVLTPALREKMGKAAVAAARASGYVNAGTVEFLVDRDNQFYFLEVNTRLQVEHPVTEMITGVDLVRLQIEIASGLPLPLSQEEVAGRGHAMECRIYAEDPENDFFPSPGEIIYLKEPSGPGVRNDSGIYTGCRVPVEYDPILSKLIVHASNRQETLAKMLRALQDHVILGVKTPIPFLIDVIRSEAFRSGDTYTDFIERNFGEWKLQSDKADLACAAYIIDELEARRGTRKAERSEPGSDSPWRTLGNWRM